MQGESCYTRIHLELLTAYPLDFEDSIIIVTNRMATLKLFNLFEREGEREREYVCVCVSGGRGRDMYDKVISGYIWHVAGTDHIFTSIREINQQRRISKKLAGRNDEYR